MNVAAYLRKTPTGVPVSDQLETLKRRARERDWNIVFHGEDPGWHKAGALRRNPHFLKFLQDAIHGSSIRVQGLMFWHAGHMAGSLASFLEITKVLLLEYRMDWYVENPRLDSRDDSSRLLMSLTPDLLGIHQEITGLNLRERTAAMKVVGTNPGRQKLPPKMEADVRNLKFNGFTIKEIAKAMKISNSTVARVLKERPVAPSG